MSKRRVFLTGASGAMGWAAVQELVKDPAQEVVALVRPSNKNRRLLAALAPAANLVVRWGDLTDYGQVAACVEDAEVVLHVGALVSPAADYDPDQAMRVNWGSTRHILRAAQEQGRQDDLKLVYIGTIAETGDRMPPIHWGRVGDPVKPSVFDYYAVSKVAAERLVIESGLKHWVSLRQTGIIGQKMSQIKDPIIFHNCLDNVLEYVSDRDSATLLANLCAKDAAGELGPSFWGHIFNIGGGESCRISCHDMFTKLFGLLGLKDLSKLFDSKWFATRNFHGTYYLDSDKLDDILDFRQDSMDYYYDSYLESLGPVAKTAKLIAELPGGQRLISASLRKQFQAFTLGEHGTATFIEQDMEDHIAAYWGSRAAWEAIPPLANFEHFTDWDKVVPIDHGFDESKPPEELTLADVKGAAEFRGGACLATAMRKGDWVGKLGFRCAFGHSFEASPRLVLEGGHWCPDCERHSWNYHRRAAVDPFFAQVWNPLHGPDEAPLEVIKRVTELDVP
jgi:nucleoside-diphosphate-sugar epimerase